MRVVLYMAITANGLIAKPDDSNPFTSDEGWESFFKKTQEIGNVIIGKTTFDVMNADKQIPLKNCFTIVVTHQKMIDGVEENIFFTDRTPEWILTYLEEKGFKEALLAGGSQINSLFMEQNLVDEIYLDVEPVIFTKGIPLFASSFFEAELSLLETKKLNSNTIQLHYKVKK